MRNKVDKPRLKIDFEIIYRQNLLPLLKLS